MRLKRKFRNCFLGRPLTRSTARNGTTQSDTFGYNARSELTSATLGNDEYAYAFDNIGNRATETVAMANSESQVSNYSTNNLNQYTNIVQSSSSLQEEGPRRGRGGGVGSRVYSYLRC